MQKRIRWITETAALLALLICLQWAGSMIPTPGIKQLVTGTCVNAVLAVTAFLVGISGGVTLAIISPLLAYALGIAPQALTVPAIMLGNSVYVILLFFVAGKDRQNILRQTIAWIVAALAKFLALYAVVVWLICDVFAPQLLESGVLKAPMLKALPTTFSWTQLITALAGGAIALVITPSLRKALHK